MAVEHTNCTICGITKVNAEFEGRKRQCKECRTKARFERANSSVQGFLQIRLTALKQRHKSKKFDGEIVSLDYLVSLYEQQRGICALSGIPMHVTLHHTDLTVSPDRIDTNKGYIEGNVRLVCARANMMRSTLDDHDFVWWCRAVVNNGGN